MGFIGNATNLIIVGPTGAGKFVGQYPVDKWHERLGSGIRIDYIMNRIIHNAYEIPTNETNLRKIYDSKS